MPAPLRPPKDSDIIVLGAAPTTPQPPLLADVGIRLIALVATRQALPQSLFSMVERVVRMIHLCLQREAPHVEMPKDLQIGANLRSRQVLIIRIQWHSLQTLLRTPTPLPKEVVLETPKSQFPLKMHKPSFYRVLAYSWRS